MDPEKIPSADKAEFERFKRVLNPKNAGTFADTYRLRPEYGMYVFEMNSPQGEAVINEFNFKSEDVAKAAVEAVNALSPVQ